jgi:hypothetical protein
MNSGHNVNRFTGAPKKREICQQTRDRRMRRQQGAARKVPNDRLAEKEIKGEGDSCD